MPITAIDTDSGAFSAQSTVLDGVEYILRIMYNQREQCYHLSIQDPNTGGDIISGIKIVSNYGLIYRYRGMPGMPPGDLVAKSNTSDDSPADIGELGTAARVTLLYLDATYLSTGQ